MKSPPEAPPSPYPYPYPLPEAVKHDHLGATQAWQNRINKWNGFVLLPGIVLVVIALVWGNGRSSGPEDESLWESAEALAFGLLGAGVVLISLATVVIVRAAKAKGRHTTLLKTYHVQLDQSGKEITPGDDHTR